MLLALLIVPALAALLTFLASSKDSEAGFRLPFALALAIAVFGSALVIAPASYWPAVSFPWFTMWGTGATVHLSLASDGLSGWLIQLVIWLTPVAILGSRRALGNGIRDFAAALLIMEALMIGSLLARDVVVFYFCYEAMLVPMLVIIAVFGGPERRSASLWFFLYTMLGSVFMLVGIWFLAWKLGTTDIAELSSKVPVWLATLQPIHALSFCSYNGCSTTVGTLLFLAFLLAFAVKVPLIPFHSWQARTYAEAPAGAVVMLAGVMAKIGVYGLIRLVLPMFPEQVVAWSGVITVLGLIGLIGGALVALAEDDIKRMFAWSSLSHLSLVVIGVFSLHPAAMAGVPVQMVAHGLSVAALFLLAGYMEQRAAVRGLDDFGGLATVAPRFAILFVIASLASAGLPGTANFAGEFLILLGTYEAFGIVIAAIAGLSVILGAIYTLRAVQRWLYGKRPAHLDKIEDLGIGEIMAVLPLLVMAFVFGFYPKPISAQAAPVLEILAAPARAIPPENCTSCSPNKPETKPAPAATAAPAAPR